MMNDKTNTTIGGYNTAEPAEEFNADTRGALHQDRPPFDEAWHNGTHSTQPDSTTMKNETNTKPQSHNDNQLEQSAPAKRSGTQNLSVSAAELHMLLDVDSSYEDFRDVEIPRILGRAGLTHYSYSRGESGHRQYSLELSHIIVSSKGDFKGLMAAILFEEAMQGMHSAASLTVQIIEVISRVSG